MSNQVRELEKRIEELEQEVQLLTVQIKYTLLEIQEHLLNGTYPALQSSDLPGASLETPAAPAAEKKSAPRSPISRITLDESGQVTDVETATVTATPAVTATPKAAAPQPQKEESLEALEDWMLKKVQQVGPARTRRLIEIYAQNGQLSAAAARALEQLLSVYDDSPAPAAKQSSKGRSPGAHNIPPLPDEIRRAVEYEVQEPRASKPRTAAPAAAKPRPAARQAAQPKMPSKPAPVSAPGTQTQEHPNNMVLRLIAGVQNAGIGVTRRKSNG